MFRFKSLANFFRGDHWAEDVVASFDRMLALAQENFELCADQLLDGEKAVDIRDEIYARDREINEQERKIRRRILTHYAISATEHDIPTAFILTSLVKDAERIGDYVKNLYELRELVGKSGFERTAYDRYYDKIRTQIKSFFAETRLAFRQSEPERARAVIAEARGAMRRCEAAIREIASSHDSVPEAVALVLAGRHFKRIIAHLVNIATAVVVPADRLDYYDEPNSEVV